MLILNLSIKGYLVNQTSIITVKYIQVRLKQSTEKRYSMAKVSKLGKMGLYIKGTGSMGGMKGMGRNNLRNLNIKAIGRKAKDKGKGNRHGMMGRSIKESGWMTKLMEKGYINFLI